MMLNRVGRRALAFVFAVVGTVPVWSQSRPIPDAAGTWKPWQPFAATASARQDQATTPALVKAFEAELAALNGILRRASGVASPVGFSVETWGNLAGYHVPEQAPAQPAGAAMPLARLTHVRRVSHLRVRAKR
jgi:hypothetical protein